MVMSSARVSVFVAGAAIAAAGMAYYTGMLDSYFAEERQPVVAQIDGEAGNEADTVQAPSDDNIQPDDAAMRIEEAQPVEIADDASVPDESEAAAEISGADEDDGTSESVDLIVPAFDLLRVDPDGGMVVAGRAAPGSDVEIQTGDSILAVTKSGIEGDFAAVLDEPLEPGDYQFVLRATGEDEIVVTSKQTALVSIPETHDGDVLALVDEPGEPARLITLPAGEGNEAATAQEQMAEPTESEVAQAQPAETGDGAEVTDEVVDDQMATVASDMQAGDDVGQESAASQQDESVDLADPGSGNAPGSPADGDEETGISLSDGEIDIAALQDAAAGDPGEEIQAESRQEQEIAATGRDEVQERVADIEAGPGVVVDAVEIEGDKIFVAGRATPGHTVRVYANSDLLGDAVSEPSGTFLVDVRRDLPVGDYIIRADLLDAEGSVLARAAVPFMREEGETLAAVAPQLVEGSGEDEMEGQTASDRDAGADAASTAGPEQGSDDDGALAGSEHEETVRPELNEGIEDEAEERPQTAIAVAPVEPAVSAQSGASDEAEAEREAASRSASQPASAATADQAAFAPTDVTAERLERVEGSVIIRRGDTLWHISRRVYGQGIRYSTIYIANQDQIRDPDLIWPGQIFAVPGETMEGEPADLGALEDRAAMAGGANAD